MSEYTISLPDLDDVVKALTDVSITWHEDAAEVADDPELVPDVVALCAVDCALDFTDWAWRDAFRSGEDEELVNDYLADRAFFRVVRAGVQENGQYSIKLDTRLRAFLETVDAE